MRVDYVFSRTIGLMAIAGLVFSFEATAQTRLDLQTAKSQAAQSNEDFRIIEARIERAQALRREALSGLLPQVGLGVTTTINGQEIVLQDRVITPRVDWGGSAFASIMLFDGRQYPTYSAAGLQVEATEKQAEWTRHLLNYEVEQAFYALAAAERELEIAENAVALRRAYADRANALAEQGVAIPLDAARAESQVLVAEQTVLASRAHLGNQADQLAILLGQEPGASIRVDASKEGRPTPPESTEGPANRRDLETEAILIEALKKQEDAIWWSLLPSLELRTTGRVGPQSLSNPDNFLWAVSLNLNWLLYDGGARYARARAIASETEIATLELAANERRVQGAYAGALRDWKAAFEAINVASRNLEVSRSAYEMATARFDAGLATSIEVTEASDELFRAELTLVQMELAADLAASRYRFARGVGQ